MDLPHAFQDVGIGGVGGQVVDVVRVFLAVVEFFDGLRGREVVLGGFGELSRFVQTPEFCHRGALLGRVHVLIVRLERFVVADVEESFVSRHANDVVPFVHAVAGAVDIVARFGEICSQERLSLNVVGHVESGESENGRAEVDRADELVCDLARFPWPSTRNALGIRTTSGICVPES
jgi:hypothetical protein